MALLADKIIQFDIENIGRMMKAVSRKVNLVLSKNIAVVLDYL